jgi:hypothetical protein
MFTSIASIFDVFKEPRYMDIPEFLFDLNSSFVKIKKPDHFGDLIRFVIPGDIHAFTFLGVDSKDPNKQIVLTKNGYSSSYFTIMDAKQVYDIYSPGVKAIEYYRPVRPLLKIENERGLQQHVLKTHYESNPLPLYFARTVPLSQRPVLSK